MVRTTGQVFGERVRAYRERAGLKQEDLANLTKQLGHPMNRVTIAKIEGAAKPDARPAERTRADNATIVDLLVLAAALDVPPMLLIVPLGESDEPIPIGDKEVQPNLFVDWFEGEAPLTTGTSDEYGHVRMVGDPARWGRNSQPLELMHEHRRLVRDVGRFDRLLNSEDVGYWDEQPLARIRSERDAALRLLDQHRLLMARLGLAELPAIPRSWFLRMLEMEKGYVEGWLQ